MDSPLAATPNAFTMISGLSGMTSIEERASRGTVVMFREVLLGASETFIANQAHSITARPLVLAGLTWKPNSLLQRHEVAIAFDGPLASLRRRLFRIVPRYPRRFYVQLGQSVPQLVHSHFGTDALAGQALASALRVPHAITFHGFDATVHDAVLAHGSFVQRRFVQRRSQLCGSAALIIAVSRFIRDELILRGVPADRIQVHYTGVDTTYFAPSARSAYRPHLLFVARLVAKKGVSHFLTAVMRLLSQIPELIVTVIGDGPDRALVQQAAKLDSRVRYLGVQSPAEVRAALNEATVFCVPSLTGPDGDAEGFGMVFAEAQSMGVPVVSFASGGVREAVHHGSTGLLAKEGDTDELTKHLHTMLTLPEEHWRLFSTRARALVLQSFDIVRQAEALDSLYTQTIRSHLSNGSKRS